MKAIFLSKTYKEHIDKFTNKQGQEAATLASYYCAKYKKKFSSICLLAIVRSTTSNCKQLS